jgi:magnesium transporter
VGGDTLRATLVGTIHGMNFGQMPELGWSWGYPMAIMGMLITGRVLYLVFKHRRWL